MGANFLSPQFWDSANVTALGKCGKLLFACLVTGPYLSKVPGIYRAFPALFHHAMRPWDEKNVDDAWEGILVAGMAQYDSDSRLLRIPNVGKYHPPQNPKQILSWRTHWVDLPNVNLKFQHLDSLRELAARSKNTGPAAFERYFSGIRQGFPETYPFDRSTLDESRGGKHYPKEPAALPDRNLLERDSRSISPGESGEEEDPDQDLDLDQDQDPRYRNPTRYPIGTVNGVKLAENRVSGRVSVPSQEGSRDSTVQQEGDDERRRAGVQGVRFASEPASGHGVRVSSPTGRQPSGFQEGDGGGGRPLSLVQEEGAPVPKRRRRLI